MISSKPYLTNEKTIIFTMSFVFLFFSQVLIPGFNGGRDIFLLSSWSLFSHRPTERIHELTWDGGQSFLFRDYRTEATVSKINLTTLKHLLDSWELETLKKHFCPSLLSLSGGSPVGIVSLKGTWAKHIFSNDEPQPLELWELCQ